jgi:hypothetical protein
MKHSLLKTVLEVAAGKTKMMGRWMDGWRMVNTRDGVV